MKRFFFWILVLGLASVPIVVFPRIIKIRNIKCISQYGPCSSDLEGKIKKTENKNLYSAKKEIENVLKKEILVTSYSTRLKLPNSLEVNVYERKVEVALRGEDPGSFALADKEGTIISFQEKTELPFLIIKDKLPTVGEKAGNEIKFYTQILVRLFPYYGIKSGVEREDGMEVEMPDGKKIIFPQEGEVDVLLGSLELIVSRLNSESPSLKIENIKTIDLRFKNPVIK